jgi:hypothetical protein
MAAGPQVSLRIIPRSYGPLPAKQPHPQQLKKHGRQYSVQLDIGDKPVDHVEGESEEGGKGLPPLPAAGVYESCCG